VPRYTSYLPAAQFSDAVGEADLLARLDGMKADTPLSLYVHIPYCHDICWYCGCNTGAAIRVQRLTGAIRRLFGGRGKAVQPCGLEAVGWRRPPASSGGGGAAGPGCGARHPLLRDAAARASRAAAAAHAGRSLPCPAV
jgi:hypothetical protein